MARDRTVNLVFLKTRPLPYYNPLATLHRELFAASSPAADAPLPWWMEVHHKARETHRSVDMQLLLATGDDLDAAKERRGKCKPISA